jgi:hypothetical protein
LQATRIALAAAISRPFGQTAQIGLVLSEGAVGPGASEAEPVTPEPEPAQPPTSGQGAVTIVSRAVQLDRNNQGAAAVYDPSTRTLYLGGPGEGHADVLPESGETEGPDVRGLTIVRDEGGGITVLNYSATFDRGVSPEDMPAIVEALRAHLEVSSLDVDMADPHADLRGDQGAGGVAIDLNGGVE